MKTNFLKSILCIALTSVVFTGCVNDDDYAIPSLDCVDQAPAATKTVAEIYAQATATATLYNDNDVIEARVVSSDKGGNFYKIIYMVSLDGTRGFSVAVNQSDLFTDYNVGRKVAIKLQGLYTQIRNNTLQIGVLYNGNVGQIAAADYLKKLARTCDVVDEETLVNSINLSEISNDYIGKLIELKDVQFADSALGQNYYNPANVVGSETNHFITDATGATLIFRTGNFAEYKGMPVSSNSGKIRGILTKFGSDFQFVARYTTDIKLTEERIGGEPETPEEPETPGNPGAPSPDAAFLFPGGDFENFPSFIASLNSFGLSAYATQSAGTGIDGSASLFVSTPGLPGNGYTFTTFPYAGMITNPTKIQFYIKGTAAKSFSFNIYKTNGEYYPFNLESATVSKTLVDVPMSVNNQYAGTIDTGGQWILITLDISGLTGVNFTDTTKNFFAVKVGKDAAYNIHFDKFTIE